MELHNAKEQLYLETDMLVLSQGASLLQMRDRMQFLQNKTPDNSML